MVALLFFSLAHAHQHQQTVFTFSSAARSRVFQEAVPRIRSRHSLRAVNGLKASRRPALSTGKSFSKKHDRKSCAETLNGDRPQQVICRCDSTRRRVSGRRGATYTRPELRPSRVESRICQLAISRHGITISISGATARYWFCTRNLLWRHDARLRSSLADSF